MKRYLFVFLFLVVCSTQGKSQVYHEMVTDSTAWKTIEAFWSGGGWDDFTLDYAKTFFFYIQGDTIIDSISYKCLYSTEEIYQPIFPSFDPDNGLTFVAAIREQDKKVFMREYHEFNNELYEEAMMYDFGLEVGDTVHFTRPFEDFMVVQEIDSVQIETGEYRRRTKFDGDERFDWIEGIGTTSYHLFYPFTIQWLSGIDLRLLCVCTPLELLHIGTRNIGGNYVQTFSDCARPAYLKTTSQESNRKPVFFPNPVIDNLRFKDRLEDMDVEIISETGQRLRFWSSFSGSSVNLQDLPPGLYILKLSGSETFHSRFIKLD